MEKEAKACKGKSKKKPIRRVSTYQMVHPVTKVVSLFDATTHFLIDRWEGGECLPNVPVRDVWGAQ